VIEQLITFLSSDPCVYNGTRRRSQNTENSSLPFTTVLRCRHLLHPDVDVILAPGEQVSEAWRIRFLGSAVATTRWTSSSLYAVFADLHRRSTSSNFALFSADNPTVRMSILSLLFVLLFLLSLILKSSTFSQIVVLVINHLSLIHTVVLLSELNYASLNCYYYFQQYIRTAPLVHRGTIQAVRNSFLHAD